jgi:pyrimidine-nucleoside phosphorylase
MLAYPILARKRFGGALSAAEIRAVVAGATDSSWSEAQLAAFLMAAAIQGLNEEETHHLTMAMLESGEQWDLASDVPGLVDKHSTGGVGDKVSLILAPLLAACNVPVVMLTGRALGHTAGTADKLDSLPGLNQELDRTRSLAMLDKSHMAIGVATADIAPADRHLYRLRDQTATVESLPLITGSILSKKLASGAEALVFDVKTGNGAFMSRPEQAKELAEMLVGVTSSMGRVATALITDMSQPLGDWVGHLCEIRETLECLEGDGPENLMQVTLALALELLAALGSEVSRADLEAAISSGRAREAFEIWAAAQGVEPGWLASPDLALAPHEWVIECPREGFLDFVDTRQLGLLMIEAGAGRSRADDEIDFRVSLRYRSRLGDAVQQGQELARLYLRQADEELQTRFAACFQIADHGQSPPLVLGRVGATDSR